MSRRALRMCLSKQRWSVGVHAARRRIRIKFVIMRRDMRNPASQSAEYRLPELWVNKTCISNIECIPASWGLQHSGIIRSMLASPETRQAWCPQRHDSSASHSQTRPFPNIASQSHQIDISKAQYSCLHRWLAARIWLGRKLPKTTIDPAPG